MTAGSALASPLAGPLDLVRSRIAAAALRAGRDPSEVTLVAISKTRSTSDLMAALACGQRVFGENYAQELREKAQALADSPHPPQFHFVGGLQRNKVKAVVGVAGLIHSISSTEIAFEVNRRSAAGNRVQDVLVEVNIGLEPQKHGVVPDDLPAMLTSLREMNHVRCLGLMTMPPRCTFPEDSRRHFRALRALATEHDLSQLSMGTTDDFEIAIEEGSTLVRIGTAIFGPRSARCAPVASSSIAP